MKISSKLNELKPTDLNCNVFDVYSYDSLSMQDLLCQFFTKINECIKVSNETIDLALWLVNEGLKIEVVEKLMLWLNDGTLENLINVNLFNTLHTKIENTNSQMSHLYNTELNINFFEGETKEEKLINMINYAIDNNYKKVFVPSGNYNFEGVISDTILLKESFNKIIIEGENPKTTIFNYSHLVDKSFMKVRGGSGQLCKGYIKNITFIGNATTTAIELNHVCGYEIVNCIFNTNKRGVLMHNSHNGGFTEFNVVRNCDFYQSCSISLEYKITNNGDRSFHGSGMKECVINQSSTESNPKIIIGEGCLPYNSPLEATFFIRCATPLISNFGYSTSNFYGNIKTEQFGTTYNGLICENRVYLVGGVNSLTQVKLGGLILCDRVQLNSDGSVNVDRKKYNIQKSFTGKKTDVIVKGDNNEALLVVANIATSFYEYTHILLVYHNSGDNGGYVIDLGTTREFNQAGYGKGTFSYSDGLIYTNNNIPDAVNTSIMATVNSIGSRMQYFTL